MFVPAAPGGGWDGLGRAIEQVARGAGLVGNFQFENVGGAGGSVGLPRFVAQRRGRPDSLMVAGSVMVGATLTNKTPVGIKDVTPIARLTEEVGAVVVPASSDIRDIKGFFDALKANPGADQRRRRLGGRHRPHHARPDAQGARALGEGGRPTSPSRAAARRTRRSWAGR